LSINAGGRLKWCLAGAPLMRANATGDNGADTVRCAFPSRTLSWHGTLLHGA
jgi:hypothetical protein